MSVQSPSQNQPHLGLVCITISDQVRYRALTRKRLLQFDEPEQREILHALYTDNISRFHDALNFCRANHIRLYRYTAKLFPFADTELGDGVLQELADQVAALGQRATVEQIRLIVHPEQFVVLSSVTPRVVRNSIALLEMHARILDMLQQPRSAWAPIEIHGGKSGRGTELAAVIRDLPEGIRTRLVLENDENAYSAAEILAVCREAGVPMVFDAHHHVCKEGLESYEHPSVAAMVAAARETWPDPAWQVVHISNGRESFGDRRHSDLITQMPDSYRNVPWIEVEAKHKEEAIRRVRQEWSVFQRGDHRMAHSHTE